MTLRIWLGTRKTPLKALNDGGFCISRPATPIQAKAGFRTHLGRSTAMESVIAKRY